MNFEEVLKQRFCDFATEERFKNSKGNTAKFLGVAQEDVEELFNNFFRTLEEFEDNNRMKMAYKVARWLLNREPTVKEVLKVFAFERYVEASVKAEFFPPILVVVVGQPLVPLTPPKVVVFKPLMEEDEDEGDEDREFG